MTTAVEPEVSENLPVLSQQRPVALLRPIAQPTDLLRQQDETRGLITKILKPGRDFGEIPGVEKASLLKPGAERICIAFGTFPRFRILSQEIDHDREVPWVKRRKVFEGKGRARVFKGWEEEKGVSYGLYRYVVECEIVARELGIVVGSCVGSCSTMESKYVDRPRDSENTVLQMAEKRAHVAATRITFGLSDQFTQDVEDNPDIASTNGERHEDAGREPAPPCPKCQGAMYDNRDKNLERVAEGKKRMPDFKCKNADCKDAKGETTVVWHLEEKPEAPAAEETKPDPDQEPVTDEQHAELKALLKARGMTKWSDIGPFLTKHLGRPEYATVRDYRTIKEALRTYAEVAGK